MSRANYPRPQVRLWKGRSGVKLWKAEWHSETGKHCACTWPCKDFSKKEAQAALDQLVRQPNGSPAAGSNDVLSVERFWSEIYWPTKSLRIQPNTRHSYGAAWNCHIRPGIGSLALPLVNKAAVDGVLNQMARAGLSESTLATTLYVMKGLFEDALENDYIPKDPTRKVVVPLARPAVPTRSLTEEEVASLFEGLSGRDYIFWRVLGLTGCRISEVLALGKADVLDGDVKAIKVTKSAYNGKAGTTKNKKARLVPIPATLAREVKEYAGSVEGHLLFPNTAGNMMQRSGHVIQEMLKRARATSGIGDLTFRQCRTTFATHWDGDYKDLQDSLGHQSVDVTMGSYRKAQLERQQTTVERLEARFTGRVVGIEKRVG